MQPCTQIGDELGEKIKSLPNIEDLIKDKKRIWLVLAKNYDTELFYKELFARLFTLEDEKFFPKMNGIRVSRFRIGDEGLAGREN